VAVGGAELVIGPVTVELPTMTLENHLPEAMEPGWTLFDLTGLTFGRPLRFVAVDEQGRVRWFHQRIGETGRASANDIRVLPEGLLLGGAGWVGVNPAIIQWDGTPIWEGEINQHHDIRLYPDSNHFTFLSVDGDCPGIDSHRVMTIRRATGEVTWDWRHCEHWVPDPLFRDWAHLNTVEPFPDGASLLISSRHQSTLFKVNVATSEIEWMLGSPPSAYAPSDTPRIALAEGDSFLFQHAADVEVSGNILLFDNGNSSRRYSRVIEIAIDEVAMTAEVVWEYRHNPDIYAGQWGDADRLPNGNVLSVWGQKNGVTPSRIVEVSETGEVVWELVTPGEWGIYRADRIPRGEVPYGYVLAD